jgi:predicted amidohydrolase YtcJ
MDAPGRTCDWMLIEEGSIAAIGGGPVPEELKPGARRLDLGPHTVLPALHDAHVHLLRTGLMDVDLDLAPAESYQDVLDLIAAAAASHEGEVLRAHSFDPDLIREGRYPTASELDAISRNVAIFVKRRDGHSSSANSKALELLDLPEDLPGIETEGGRPTGVLRGKAHSLAFRKVDDLLTDRERVDCYRRAARRAAERGIGAVHALVGSSHPGNRDVEVLLSVADDLPIDVVVYPQIQDVERVASMGLPRIGGCLLLDGSFSSGTAALEDDYADREGRGNLYFTDDDLTGFMKAAHQRGFQIAVHALGERAIAQAIRCYRAAAGGECRSARHRIEHCELPKPEHLEAIADLGIAVCVQPAFEAFWGGPGKMYEARLGAERAGRSNPFRSMLEAGIRLAGGSDSYVTPMDSLLGIDAAVNRPNVAERLDAFDAVSLFTSGASWFSFDEDRRGTLEVGKDASFVVLESDPLDVDPTSIKDVPVAALFVRGERVAPASRAPSR